MAAQRTLFDQPAPRPRYPDVPGSKERGGTSERAAREIASRAGVLRGAVLRSLAEDGPGTPDEIAERLGESVLSIRPRCSELIAQGLARKTSQRRVNRSGKRAAVLTLGGGPGR